MTDSQRPPDQQPEHSGQYGQYGQYGQPQFEQGQYAQNQGQYAQDQYGQSPYGQVGQQWPAQSPTGPRQPKPGPKWALIVPWVLSAALAIALVIVLVIGDTDGDDSNTTASDRSSPSRSASSSGPGRPSSSAPSSSSPSGPPTNDRGNIELNVGDEALVVDEDSGETVVTIVVEQITPDVPCTERYADPAENGHLTAVQISATTTPALPADSYFSVSAYDFRFIGSDGRTVSELSTYAAYSCVASNTQFPSDQLAPGSQYSGVVILDLPETSGVLIFSPTSFFDTAGWEWSF